MFFARYVILGMLLIQPFVTSIWGNYNKPILLKVDGRTDPLVVDNFTPFLTWSLDSLSGEKRNISQKAYQIQAASSREKLSLGESDLWDSGRVLSQSAGMAVYQGKTPVVGQSVYWRVKVWFDDRVSDWSEVSSFENNFLAESDWTGSWIGMNKYTRKNCAPYLRGDILLDKKIKKARAYICGLGWSVLYVNGQRIGEGVMDPAQTDYDIRCLYNVLDITDAVLAGKPDEVNVGVILGDGWYNQWLAWTGANLKYGEPKLKAQFIFEFTDGTFRSVPADLSWKAITGPVLENNVHRGEVYDARLELENWMTNKPDNAWDNVCEMPAPGGELIPQVMPSEKKIKEVETISFKQVESNKWVYNFGENLSGWVRLKINACKGTKIRMVFAEKIQPDGNLELSTTGFRDNGTVQADYYFVGKDGENVWEPEFTFHGFQYAELFVEGGELLSEVDAETLTAVVVHSALPTIGYFECSDKELNRLHDVAVKTLLAGMHGLPMDCPVRERCGWTGDAHAISQAMLFNFDAVAFFKKYISDIETGGRLPSDEPRTASYNSGALFEPKPSHVPHMIAPGKRRCGAATPDWGSAMVFIPWQIYLETGDKSVLEDFYQPMANWINYLLKIQDKEEGINTTGLGDWCAPSMRRAAEAGVQWRGSREIPILSTTMLIRCCDIMEKVSKILDKKISDIDYHTISKTMSARLLELYFDEKARHDQEKSQTALSMAYRYIDGASRTILLDSLLYSTSGGETFDTGIYATPVLLDILATEGYGSIARKLLTKKEYPSYRAMLDMGATSLWEYWPTQGGQAGYEAYDGSMSHPMHAGYDTYLYTNVAGLRGRNENGRWEFSWNNDPDINWARASHRSQYGLISSEWQKKKNVVYWTITIPAGHEMQVYIPVRKTNIKESGKPLFTQNGKMSKCIKSWSEEKTVSGQIKQNIILGSGTYYFSFRVES